MADISNAINSLVQPSTPPPSLQVKETCQTPQSVTAFTTGHCPGKGGGEDENNSFDPSLINSDDEPNLFPPDPHEN